MNVQARIGADGVAEISVKPLLLLNNLDVGGAQTAVLNLAVGLRATGCEPTVVAWRRSGPLEERFRAAGLRLELPSKTERGGWRRIGIPGLISRIARKYDLNLVHAHLSDSATWAALAQWRGLPAAITHHTTDLIDTVGIGRPLYGWARRRLLVSSSRHVTENIAVSESVREQLIAAGVPGGRIAVIENGLPQPPLARVEAAVAQRRARAANGAGPVVVAVGRLTREKGFHTLIKALRAVSMVRPEARVVILGDGPYRAALLGLVTEMGLQGRVDMPGFSHEVGRHLETADLLAAPSHIEGLPMAVLEAMAWGVPVVASDIPGHRDLVEDEVTGLTVPIEEPEKLSAAVLRALADGDETVRRVRRALEGVQRRYSVDATARRHLDLYRVILAPRR